jgi:predicted phage replisome organizer
MSSIKWIKINTDMFDDEKIKIIQSMPEGDALLVVWIRLITLAGKTNNGGYIYISDNLPYTDEMLSTIMNKPLNIIKLAIQTFINFGMIEIDEKGIYLVNFEKHQSLDRMQEIREYNRLAQQKHRAKLKCQKMSLTSQNCHDIDKDIDKDIDNSSSISLIDAIEKEFGSLSSMQYEEIDNLSKTYDNDLILEAVKECAINNVRTIKYLKGILNNWQKENIKSVSDLKNKKEASEEQPVEIFEYDWINDENV